MLNLMGALFYAIAVALCLRSAIAGFRSADAPGRTGFWIFCAICFSGLIAMRLHGAEDLLRNALREVLRADGSYAARRVIQAPAAAAVLLGFSAFAALFAARALRVSRGRRARAVNHAFLALAVMAGLIALRIVSFHPIDALLYRPLHLNWVIDIGATAAVVWSAHAYRAALARPAAV